MSRLVVISNRLADPRKPAAGGLAVALGETLNQTGGLWFGWSGTVTEDGLPGEGTLHTRQAGNVTLATVDLCREDHDSYYYGYSNSVLWPVFHYRLDLADFNASYIAGYRRVNQMFARKLLPLLKDDDIIWVHDYHLIPLAAELRALGCRQKIGFFLHIPVPPPLIMAAIPQHEWLMRSFFAYDLVGLQSEADVAHFTRYLDKEAEAKTVGAQRLRAFGATVQVASFPIGIDVDEFSRLAAAPESMDTFHAIRDEYSRRRLLLGIDRLDYSKGIPQRVRAFRELLSRYPENQHSATLIMIASPSRDTVNAYADLRTELEGLCGAINGDFGDLDWMPLRYIHRTVARKRVPGLCRAAAVGLVTPLRDGMNLVAKEYVAAQDPEDPGVLVLSRFAGAAEQMKEALLVNPYDTQGMADTIQTALQMPLKERQRRHQLLMERIRGHDVHWWRKTYLAALEESGEPDDRSHLATGGSAVATMGG
ncbi:MULTISPECIES: alpha,alpha-trehalose-phosphate synthase (UDP-forming) [unclassified Acidovorax]|uniref:alpha,alpha-trehalose-phosphate synthase (UDP-forming) n=1 Tax=unclassified Acidovorax TaxID=2684926 RepID=UPI0028833F03|nr:MULTISPECIES: alpha,alpha-trehalose-phosphate synthase (UDP-forming) [unclassified Acidovorax]